LAGEGRETAEDVVRHGRAVTGFWLPLLGTMAVIAVGWGIWAALAGSGSEMVDPMTAPDSRSEVEPVNNELGSSDVDDADDPAGGDESPVDRAEIAATSEIGPDVGSDGPILGSDVDYDLLVGTSERPAVVDLDSGKVRYADGGRFEPVAVSGSWLVGRAGSSVSTSAELDILPLDDLGADPTRLLEDDPQLEYMDVLMQAEARPGRLWVTVYYAIDGGLGQALRLVDLVSGSLVDHPLAGDTSSSMGFRGIFPDTGGGLVTSPAGGVYTVTGDGFQFVTEGRLLAADADRALVESCDEGLRCTRRWLSRDSWQPLDLVAPDRDDAAVWVVPGTDWVFVTGLVSTDSPGLLNIETGQTAPMGSAEVPGSEFVGPPAVSPDGEWLAEPGEDHQTVVLRRLATGETKEITIDGTAAAQGPFFFVDEQ
jgi:hypothetical protein